MMSVKSINYKYFKTKKDLKLNNGFDVSRHLYFIRTNLERDFL